MWSSEELNAAPETSQNDSDEDYTPSTKKQKQKRGNWTDKNMIDAINCCKNQDIGVEEAAFLYNVPKRSLRTLLKDKNLSVIDEKYRVFVLPSFPQQAEADLVEFLQELISLEFTFTSIEVRRLAYELVSEKYQVHNLPQEKDCILGNRWYQAFMAKYPLLETEKIQGNSFQRKSNNFYTALETLITKHQINANRIFSVDGIELKFRASNADDFDKIFLRRKIIYTDAKALCCISPAGMFVPPLFIKPEEDPDSNPNELSTKTLCEIFGEEEEEEDEEESLSNDFLEFQGHTVGVEDSAFTSIKYSPLRGDKLKKMYRSSIPILPSPEDIASIRKQIKTHLNKKLQPMSEENEEELREKLYERFKQLRNKIVSRYENRLNIVSPEVFYGWLQAFVTYVQPDPQHKTLILLSDQSYIKYLRSLELAKAYNLAFLVLPPHSFHKIHPLDGFTLSLNRNLSTCASSWLGKNPNFKIQQVPLHILFKKAYALTTNPSIAKNGFVYSGIWPVNRNVFDSTELGGESLLLQKPPAQKLSVNKAQSSGGSQNVATLLNVPGMPNDLSKLCRVCMKEKMYMKPLFETTSPPVTNYHGKKISEITCNPVLPDDGLPIFVCQYCLVQLMETVKMRNLAIDSHKKQLELREALDRLFFENENKEDVFLSKFQYKTPTHAHTKMTSRVLTKDFDINTLCRICMGEKSMMTSMFFKPQGESKYYVDTYRKVAEVSQCQVHIQDGLSSNICPFCRTSINQASEFIQRIIGSDKRFREIVPQIKQTSQ